MLQRLWGCGYLGVGVAVSDEADKGRGAVLTRQVRRATAHHAHLQAPHKRLSLFERTIGQEGEGVEVMGGVPCVGGGTVG